ncbi:hypothetical protein FKP32DRAFT_1053394 [Trametes sanguinea]|nr:hypothetical protein FKP32DRAFT_1053394 [Trametes sanguinea]
MRPQVYFAYASPEWLTLRYASESCLVDAGLQHLTHLHAHKPRVLVLTPSSYSTFIGPGLSYATILLFKITNIAAWVEIAEVELRHPLHTLHSLLLSALSASRPEEPERLKQAGCRAREQPATACRSARRSAGIPGRSRRETAEGRAASQWNPALPSCTR